MLGDAYGNNIIITLATTCSSMHTRSENTFSERAKHLRAASRKYLFQKAGEPKIAIPSLEVQKNLIYFLKEHNRVEDVFDVCVYHRNSPPGGNERKDGETVQQAIRDILEDAFTRLENGQSLLTVPGGEEKITFGQCRESLETLWRNSMSGRSDLLLRPQTTELVVQTLAEAFTRYVFSSLHCQPYGPDDIKDTAIEQFVGILDLRPGDSDCPIAMALLVPPKRYVVSTDTHVITSSAIRDAFAIAGDCGSHLLSAWEADVDTVTGYQKVISLSQNDYSCYISNDESGGSLCGQACVIMACCLLVSNGAKILGTFEATSLLVDLNKGSLKYLDGCTPEMILDLLNQECNVSAFMYRDDFNATRDNTHEEERASFLMECFLPGYIHANIPVIVFCDEPTLNHGNMETKENTPQHCVLIVGVQEKNASCSMNTIFDILPKLDQEDETSGANEMLGRRIEKIILHDSAVGPFREKKLQECFEAAKAFDADHPQLAFIAVAPNNITVDPHACFIQVEGDDCLTPEDELFVRLCEFTYLEEKFRLFVVDCMKKVGARQETVRHNFTEFLYKLQKQHPAYADNNRKEYYWFITAINRQKRIVGGCGSPILRFWVINAQCQDETTKALQIKCIPVGKWGSYTINGTDKKRYVPLETQELYYEFIQLNTPQPHARSTSAVNAEKATFPQSELLTNFDNVEPAILTTSSGLELPQILEECRALDHSLDTFELFLLRKKDVIYWLENARDHVNHEGEFEINSKTFTNKEIIEKLGSGAIGVADVFASKLFSRDRIEPLAQWLGEMFRQNGAKISAFASHFSHLGADIETEVQLQRNVTDSKALVQCLRIGLYIKKNFPDVLAGPIILELVAGSAFSTSGTGNDKTIQRIKLEDAIERVVNTLARVAEEFDQYYNMDNEPWCFAMESEPGNSFILKDKEAMNALINRVNKSRSYDCNGRSVSLKDRFGVNLDCAHFLACGLNPRDYLDWLCNAHISLLRGRGNHIRDLPLILGTENNRHRKIDSLYGVGFISPSEYQKLEEFLKAYSDAIEKRQNNSKLSSCHVSIELEGATRLAWIRECHNSLKSERRGINQ